MRSRPSLRVLRRWRSTTRSLHRFEAAIRVASLEQAPGVVTIEDVRALASQLPRSYEVLVRDRVKFRVGRIVYLGFSRDESVMGFAFPKDERDALVVSDAGKFLMPRPSDLRYNWVHVRLGAIDQAEMRELVLDSWRMVVPKSVAAAHRG